MSIGPLLLAVAWTALVMCGAEIRRRGRAPQRVAALAAGPVRSSARADPLAVLGGMARRLVWRRAPTGVELDRWVGGALAGGALLAALGHPIFGVLAAAGTVALGWRARSTRMRQQRSAVEAALPDLLDLFTVAVGAGCTAELAVRAVAPHAPGALGPALAGILRRLDRGTTFADALEPLLELPDDAGGPLARLLLASHLDGVPLGPALERLTGEARRRRRRQVEEAARRLPVRLLLPLVLCTLPAFALLTVVPVLLVTLGRLH